MQNWRKTKQVNQLRAEASSLMPLTEDWLLLTTYETPLPPCIQKDFREQKGRLQEELVRKLSSILSFTVSLTLLSISGVLVNGMYEDTVSIF
jgi:hypothetical protein